jgi:hypothetical protein
MGKAFILFQTKLGWMGLVGSENGVQRIYLPEPTPEGLRRRIGKEFPESREGAPSLEQAKEEILEYLEGRRIRFGMDLDLSSIPAESLPGYARHSFWEGAHLSLAGREDRKPEGPSGGGECQRKKPLAAGCSLPSDRGKRRPLDWFFRPRGAGFESRTSEAGRGRRGKRKSQTEFGVRNSECGIKKRESRWNGARPSNSQFTIRNLQSQIISSPPSPDRWPSPPAHPPLPDH